MKSSSDTEIKETDETKSVCKQSKGVKYSLLNTTRKFRSSRYNLSDRSPRSTSRSIHVRKTISKDLMRKDVDNVHNSRRKFYEPSKMDMITSDDTRISKTLRRLIKEDDPENFAALCKQLQDSFVLVENERYIVKAMEFICESMIETFHNAPDYRSKLSATKCLSHLAVALNVNVYRFFSWLFSRYVDEGNFEIRLLLMNVILNILNLDRTAHSLTEVSGELIDFIHSELENVDIPDMLLVTSKILVVLLEDYIDSFADIYKDTVDIVVGWYIDIDQPTKIVRLMALCIRLLEPYLKADMGFTLGLLEQLMDDIERYRTEFIYIIKCGIGETIEHCNVDVTEFSITDYARRIAKAVSFMKVFNSLVKSVGEYLCPKTTPAVTSSFLLNCLTKTIDTITLSLNIGNIDDEIYISGNECIWLLIPHLQNNLAPIQDLLLNLITTELENVPVYHSFLLASLLQLIAKVIKEGGANLPLEFIDVLIGPNSFIVKLRFSVNYHVNTGVIAVYHSLLDLKNILLLQEAYRYILGDMQKAFLVIEPNADKFCSDNPFKEIEYDKRTADLVLLFYMKALSNIANSGSSIIGMWALKPCVLELLAIKLKPTATYLNPIFRYSVLCLMYSHCTRYSNFISSSELVNCVQRRSNVTDLLKFMGSDTSSSSPTGGHLNTILKVLSTLITMDIGKECSLLIFRWTAELINQMQVYITTLLTTNEFISLIRAVINAGSKSTKSFVIISVCNCLHVFIYTTNNCVVPSDISEDIVELCLIRMTSLDNDIKENYKKLLLTMNWSTVIITLENLLRKSKGSYIQVLSSCRRHMIHGESKEVGYQDVKLFMQYILEGKIVGDNNVNVFVNIFDKCWTPNIRSNVHDLGSSISFVLLFWHVWECAQYCISNRLRTPLGKPHETFIAVEGMLNNLVKESYAKSSDTTGESPYTLQRVRLLLEFLEHLEKAIYNASEGTAVALPFPTKTVKSFFRMNKTTCSEWFTRHRKSLVRVSFNAGLSSSVIRHGYQLLHELVKSGNVKSSDFESTVRYVSCAFCNLKESEAIKGLYVWCRNVANVKLSYLIALSDQAAGRFESAAENYQSLIKDLETEPKVNSCSLEINTTDSNKLPSDSLKCFIADQLTECYLNSNDWIRLKQWKKYETPFLSDVTCDEFQKFRLLTTNDVELFEEMDLGSYDATSLLAEWTLPIDDSEIPKFRWNSYQTLKETKHHYLPKLFFSSMVEHKLSSGYPPNISNYIDTLEMFIIEDVRNMPSPFIREYITMLFAAHAFYDMDLTGGSNFTLDVNMKKMESKVLADALWWYKLIEIHQKMNPVMPKYLNTIELRLQLSKSARKERNLHLASQQLLRYFQSVLNISPRSDTVAADEIRKPYDVLLEVVAEQTTLLNGTNLWNVDNVSALLQFAKLSRGYNNNDVAVEICSLTSLGIAGEVNDPFIREKGSRLLLYLSRWLSSTNIAMQDVPASVHKLLCLLEHSPSTLSGLAECDLSNEIIPPKDIIIGKFLKRSVAQSPNLPKAWSQFADWCYKWGRRIVGVQSDILSADDKTVIDRLLPADVNKDEVYSVLTCMQPSIDEEDIETAENYNTVEMIEWKLKNIGPFDETQISSLIDIWKRTHARIYMYYNLSAQAYFKYLQLGDNNEKGTNIITATLRLLRLIVKYAPQLQSVLELELSYTPTNPWKSIIPQLFSRLNHPEQYVCKRISELLCRIAEDAPHLIIFPAVVGSDIGDTGSINDMPSSNLLKSYFTREKENTTVDEDDAVVVEEVDDEEELEDEVNSAKDDINRCLENCYLSMVDTLAKQAPETISQVRLFVNELRRISLLWDELWLGTLNQHHSDISRRVSQLDDEIARVNTNSHLNNSEKDYLISEKYMVLMKPVLFMLEQLQAITSIKAETPHEKWFQSKYHDVIADTINAVQNPKDFRKPNDSWKKIKELQQCFYSRASKKTSYSLKLSDVSPALATLNDTSIAMPGLKQLITISSIHNHISILPTKTKPKKLVFLGSDGKMYTYLFKGLEDLHLDERIMQFLSVANTMLQGTDYHARHYSVVPLGPHSGLISWVDHVTPIFAVYKRWQQRSASVNQNVSVRPAELFQLKLVPLLKEHGINNLDNRKEWPVSVLKSVLLSLIEETPSDLLAKELWCQSVNAGNWWRITRHFSTSLAVMSVIGYIIGLGDRHLDNVLVHLASGEVVHIDYNVCFEKGKTLRIPEKVPFRLTQNLQTALGITESEGLFRSSCEYVLKVMKAGKETLLTLLEAFVYDPLIDWTPGTETGYTGAVYGSGKAVVAKNKHKRRQLEQEVTSSMLMIRIMEIKHDWLLNRDELTSELTNLSAGIQEWLIKYETQRKLIDDIAENQQLLALLKMAETYSRHSLYSLYERYLANSKAVDSTVSLQTALNVKLEECDTQLTQYKMVFYHLHSDQITQILSDIQKSVNKKQSIFEILEEFLNSAGQKHLVQQCCHLEVSLKNIYEQEIETTEKCVNVLRKYSTVSSLFPSSCLYNHRCSVYKRWILTLLECSVPDSCQKIMKEFAAFTSNPKDAAVKRSKKFISGLLKNIQDLEKSHKSRSEKLEKTANVSEKSLSEAEQSIDKIGNESSLSLQCAIITELCTLSKKFHKMETAAVGAGDSLMGLTSSGEWFLDDMCLLTQMINKLTTRIIDQSVLEKSPELQLVLQCLTAVHDVYTKLQELNVNFAGIIVPEAVKKFLIEDESVLNVTKSLDDGIIDKCSVPLRNIIEDLQLHLHFTIMGMPSPHESCLSTVQDIKSQYNCLIDNQQNDMMSEGQMLLVGFHGLFQNLYDDTRKLFSLLPSLIDLTARWKSIDIIKETTSLIGPIFSRESQTVLQDIFLLKQLETMQEFFSKCRSMAVTYRGDGACAADVVYYTDEQLNKIVRKYTADFLSKQFLGLFSYTLSVGICLLLQYIGFNITSEIEQRDIGAESKVPLKDLCHKAIDLQRKSGKITSSSFTSILNAITNLENLWRRIAIKKKIKQEIESQEMLIQTLKLQYTTYLWMHEEVIRCSSHFSITPILNRNDYLTELKTTLNSLLEIRAKMSDLKQQENTLITSVVQRLKWASGANPSFTEILSAFENNVSQEQERCSMSQQSINIIINVCRGVLHFELFRTKSSEAKASDNSFLQLVERCQGACNLAVTVSSVKLVPAEETLVKILPPKKPVDMEWLTTAANLVSEIMKDLTSQLNLIRMDLYATQDLVRTQLTNIRSVLSSHHRIFSDIRSLLKSMMKFEESNTTLIISEYLTRYKIFVENVNALTKDLRHDMLETKIQQILPDIQSIMENMPYIYDTLIKFSCEKLPLKQPKRLASTRQEAISSSCKKRDPHTGKAVQEKNAYAVNVWRRVRMKLEGRDPDESNKLSVEEQVNWVITEATNTENLASLYEGWTPWV